MVKNNIDVTVGLPTWENKDIIWLQLESLCKQKTQYKWELVVCEEQTLNMTGEEMILSYSDRLKESGCQRISYIPLEKHIPLSKKWKMIADNSIGSTFLLASSDDYSPPNRIEFTHNKIKEGFNWVDVSCGLFLDLDTFVSATFNNQPNDTGLYMGTKTSFMKRLSGPWPQRGVDSWIRNKYNITPRYRHTQPFLGLHTDGQNKISLGRKNGYIKRSNTYFSDPKQNLEDILEPYLIDRLKNKFYKQITV